MLRGKFQESISSYFKARYFVTFEVVGGGVNVTSVVFWDVTTCSLVEICR